MMCQSGGTSRISAIRAGSRMETQPKPIPSRMRLCRMPINWCLHPRPNHRIAMSQLLTVALAQYPSGRDCMEIVAAAKAAAAEIVVFPEMYSNGYACFDPNDPAAEARWCAEAESLEGDFVGRFREAAKARRTFRASCT